MKIKKIIEDINKVDDQNTVFEESSSTLKSKFKILENIPKDLNEYLEFCIPKQPYGRMVEFHDIYTIIEENTECVPGADTIEQGFFCFAKSGDGTQFAYLTQNKKVYQLNYNAGEDLEETLEETIAEWPSLESFLQNYLKELKEIVQA